MQEMYPAKRICADVHVQAIKHRMKHTPKSLIKHLSYLELKHCSHRKTPDYEADPILIGRVVSLNEH